MVWLKQQEFISSVFWRLEIQDQSVSISPWLVHGSLCPASSHGLLFVSVCFLISFYYKDTSHFGSGLTYRTSFYPNHLFKGPLFKHSDLPRYWRLGLPYALDGGREHNSIYTGSNIFFSSFKMFNYKAKVRHKVGKGAYLKKIG